MRQITFLSIIKEINIGTKKIMRVGVYSKKGLVRGKRLWKKKKSRGRKHLNWSLNHKKKQSGKKLLQKNWKLYVQRYGVEGFAISKDIFKRQCGYITEKMKKTSVIKPTEKTKIIRVTKIK